MTTEDWLFLAGIACLIVAAVYMLGSFISSLLNTRAELIAAENKERGELQGEIRKCILRACRGDLSASEELPGLLAVYRWDGR